MSELPANYAVVDHRTLHAYLNGCIENASKKQELFTILFVFLRDIRRINTILGYEAGEEAVHIVMERIRKLLPDCDSVGRVSSDELVVVSLDCNSPSCAIKGSKSIISSLQSVISVNNSECTSNPVVGIAVYPNDGDTSAELVRHAALAAERASMVDDPYYAFFSPGLGVNALREFDLQQEIRKATSQRQFELHYQPKLNANTLELSGCEALIRWRDPTGGMRMPDEFLGAAERGGLMLPIGFLVLQTACQQVRGWIDRGYEDVSVSVNVTAKQFEKRDWVSTVNGTITGANISPSRLTLEITESFALSESSDLIGKMHELRASGTKISIDDFGTGHSSLAYLSRIPVDEIKIDRFFVQSALENATNAQICANIVELAHGIGAVVTAEGVETKEQAQWLQDLGCDIFQGYLFDRPQPVENFEAWLMPGANGRLMMVETSTPKIA
jgi:diguanylate cyclase (GGDEF)-like protein